LRQFSRLGKALERQFLLASCESVPVSRSKLRQVAEAVLDRLGYATDENIGIGDLRKSHAVKLDRRQPWRSRAFEYRRRIPATFERLADTDIVIFGLQAGDENAVGAETQETFGAPLRLV
jgi:hypothetical protein